MKVICLGGGPAGLYLGISLKLRNPDHEIEVYERNKPDDTFGWGIVFSDQTVDNISANDPVSAQRIVNEFIHWDLIDCHVSGEVERSGGHGFIGLGRKRFLQLLHERAAELGVALHFEQEIGLDDIDTRFADADVIVASDGLELENPQHLFAKNLAAPLKCGPTNSCGWERTRRFGMRSPSSLNAPTMAGFGPTLTSSTRTPQLSSSKTTPEVYDALGFDEMSHEESAETCRRIFEKLSGWSQLADQFGTRAEGRPGSTFPQSIATTGSRMIAFVLIGDAAHTAHFSIGSGTKLGLEDAISLAHHLDSGESMPLR